MTKADLNIKRILRLVKKELIEERGVRLNGDKIFKITRIGLCTILYDLRLDEKISHEEEDNTVNFIKNHFIELKQKAYYDCEGKITDEDCQFIWKPYLIEPRLKWINKIIKS